MSKSNDERDYRPTQLRMEGGAPWTRDSRAESRPAHQENSFEPPLHEALLSNLEDALLKERELRPTPPVVNEEKKLPLEATAHLMANELTWKQLMEVARFVAPKLNADASAVAEALVEWADQHLGITPEKKDEEPEAPLEK
jgi:hypothetical protein